MIEVIKTPEISLNECSLCDSILVTYTLVGEEPVTVEVESSGEMGGVNTYDIDLGEFGVRLLYYSLTQWVLDGSSNVYLESESYCPFGVYITVGGDPDIFEAFEVAPAECYTSKWSAVHHPIKWELQRKDALVVEKSIDGAGFVSFELTTTPPTGVVVGMNLTYYNGTTVISGQITVISGDRIRINRVFPTGVLTGGFIIFEGLYNNYYIETQVENIGLIRTVPNPQGKATIDVSAWLRTQTAFENTYNYASLTAIDLGQSGGYRLRFRENYNFQIGAFGSYTSKFYWSNSAKQIREAYGSNMIEYVTNLNTPVKFLSVFNRPTNFLGFPFSLSWINGGDYTKLIRRNENNGTYTALGSITSGSGAVQRLKVSDACESVLIEYGIPDFFGAFLKQGELTETKQIKINQTCLERPLAVSWMNTLGGREHWVFSYNQIHTLDTQSGATYQPNIDNLETATSNIFDLQKFAQPKISVGANVDIEDIEGLKTILYSICVEIQTAQGWIGVRPETGSFKILETKDTKATIEMTFVLPDINIQTR
jgi:hypothetical protein